MEGPLEIKHSTANAEEPIKSEAPIHNSDNSERSDGAASPPPNCSICLGKLVNTSFTDSCLHQFCFTCLLQWSKIKTECPLCKQTFKSIIHNVRSEEDYDQYHVPRELAQIPQPQVMTTFDVNFDIGGNWDVGLRRFVYRTTMTANRRHGTLLNPEQVARREQLPSMAPQVPREERRRRRANPTDYRRTVYRHGIWATSLPDIFGRFRECSAEYYRRQPQELDRLIPWLNRELQVLLNNETHAAYVLSIIMDALTQYDIRSSEFREIMRPYFHVHTDHFVHELLNFARTNFDLVGYDQSVTYLPRGLSNEYTSHVMSPTPASSSSSSSTTSSNSSSSSSSTSDNSDIRILDEAMDLRVNSTQVVPLVLPFNQPGPSTVSQLFRTVGTTPYNVPEVLIVSSNSSGSDGECEIIGYVKPRHERTPEIIELLSSDSEHAIVPCTSNENTQSTVCPEDLLPSTSYVTKESSLSSYSATSIDDDSDSDYNPIQSRRSQNRSKKSSGRKTAAQKHKRSNGTRNYNRRSANAYSSEESDFKKRVIVRVKRNRISSSSDSSSYVSSQTKCDEKRSRKARYNIKGTGRMKSLIKRELNYSNEDSCDSDSSSVGTDSKTKTNKYHRQHRSKRKRLYTSSDDYTAKNEKSVRKKERLSSLNKLRSNKDRKYSASRQSRSRSTSESSNTSERDNRPSYRHREVRDTNEYKSQDDSASMNKDMLRRQHQSKSKKKACYSSDSEDDRLRSSSQCSNHSNKSYLHWRRSSRKEKRHKQKDRDRSSSRTYNSSQSNANTSLTSVSSKSDTYPTKHSDCEEKHKSRKNCKESKHRKFQNEKKSRPKKRRRRLRSCSISNSG